ncbi:MAG: GC-type dockerin domain-anchored protein [Phycisphaerales bacterium JB039]
MTAARNGVVGASVLALTAYAAAQDFLAIEPPAGAAAASVYAVSDSGLTAAGAFWDASGQIGAFRWSACSDPMMLTIDPDPSPFIDTTANAVSSDGSVVVGQPAFVWNSTGVQRLPSLISPPGDSDSANGVSRDGSVIVGASGGLAARWALVGTSYEITQLRSLKQHPSGTEYLAVAHDVSADGSVIVGDSDVESGFVSPRAVRWTDPTAIPDDLGALPGWPWSIAHATNEDGSVVVGRSTTVAAHRGIQWKMGSIVELRPLPGTLNSVAIDVDGSGTRAVGQSWNSGEMSRATVWDLGDPGLVAQDLNYLLPTLGIDLTGWELTSANAISTDGDVIAGTGVHEGVTKGWIATIACPATPVEPLRQANYPDRVAKTVYNEYVARFPAGDPVRVRLEKAAESYNICRVGCFLTSVSMALRALDIDASASPSTLNDWLDTNGGYSRIGKLERWREPGGCETTEIPMFNPGADPWHDKIRERYGSGLYLGAKESVPTDAATTKVMANKLCAGSLFLLNVRGGSHWVVARGVRFSDECGVEFNLVDPGRADDDGWRRADDEQINEVIKMIEIARTQGPPPPRLSIQSHAAIEVTVTDPMGRQIRFDSQGGLTLAETPGAGHITFLPTDVMDAAYTPAQRMALSFGASSLATVDEQIDGTYTIDVKGLAETGFSVRTAWARADGTIGTDELESAVQVGQTISHEVSIESGSIGLKRAWLEEITSAWNEGLSDLAPDGHGGCFAVGVTWGDLGGSSAGASDAWIARYSGAGERLWMRQLGTPEIDDARSAAEDGSGGVYVIGTSDGTLGGSPPGRHAWWARFDADGNQMWIDHVAGSSPDSAYGRAAAQSVGGVLLGGDIDGGSWVALRAADGTQRWFHQFGPPPASGGHSMLWALATDGAAGAFATGDTNGDLFAPLVGSRDAWIARFDGSGSPLWNRQFGFPNSNSVGQALLADGRGGVFAVGRMGTATFGIDDAWVAHFDADGNRIAWRQFGYTPQYLRLSFRDLVSDGAGGFYATGHGRRNPPGSSPYLHPFIMRFDAFGTLLWETRFHGGPGEPWPGLYDSMLTAITDDGRGGVFVGGDEPGTWLARYVGDDRCLADCDQSGALDIFDFLCFQNLFATVDPAADCDGSGTLDIFDFLCFQNAFAAGCP